MGIFTVKKESDGHYYITLKDKNGRVILNSQKHLSKLDCINGIKTIRANATDNLKYDYKKTFDGKFYFRLKSVLGEVLGNSNLYDSAALRDREIETVKKIAPLAGLFDL
jgi:uncharacterized protein YegP (UPF0339 family)